MKLAERIFRRNDYYITSPFGMRIHPITKVQTFHYGTDYGTNIQNWEQYALEDGEVIEIKTGKKDNDGSGYGNYVKVKYPRIGIQLLHAHLKEVKVEKGQIVNKNTIIGLTGTTGTSTGIHLHLGLQKIGSTTWLDPETYDYKEGSYVMKFKIGDEVIVNGELYKGSNDTTPAGKVTNKTTKITRVAEGARHPYNTTGDLGWMDEEDIKFVVEPVTDYKELYEKQLLVNKDLQAQLDVANKKIADAMNVLK